MAFFNCTTPNADSARLRFYRKYLLQSNDRDEDNLVVLGNIFESWIVKTNPAAFVSYCGPFITPVPSLNCVRMIVSTGII